MHTFDLASDKLKSIAGASPKRPVAIEAGDLRQLCEAALASLPQDSPPKAPPSPADAFAGYDGPTRSTEA